MAFIFGSGMCFFQKMDVPYSSFAWKFTSCCWSILYIYIYLYLYIYSLHVKQKPSKACKVKSHAGLEAKATESRGLQQQGTKAQNWWCPVACLVHKPTNLAF